MKKPNLKRMTLKRLLDLHREMLITWQLAGAKRDLFYAEERYKEYEKVSKDEDRAYDFMQSIERQLRARLSKQFKLEEKKRLAAKKRDAAKAKK